MTFALRLLAATAASALLLPWQDGTAVLEPAPSPTLEGGADLSAPLTSAERHRLREFFRNDGDQLEAMSNVGRRHPLGPNWVLIGNTDGHGIPGYTGIPTSSDIVGGPRIFLDTGWECAATESQLAGLKLTATQILFDLLRRTGLPEEEIRSRAADVLELELKPGATSFEILSSRLHDLAAAVATVKTCP